MGLKEFGAVLIICCAAACNNENPVSDVPPPKIQAITFIPEKIVAGQSCIVKCTAVDSSDEVLSYEWTTIGNIAKKEGDDATVYYTPNSCCSEPKINLTVTNSRGGRIDTTFDVPFVYEDE